MKLDNIQSSIKEISTLETEVGSKLLKYFTEYSTQKAHIAKYRLYLRDYTIYIDLVDDYLKNQRNNLNSYIWELFSIRSAVIKKSFAKTPELCAYRSVEYLSSLFQPQSLCLISFIEEQICLDTLSKE